MTEDAPAARFRSPRLLEGQSIITTGVYERPVSERPSHDTMEAIAAWLIGPARRIASAPQAIDEYAWRLYAAGLPVLRVTLHCGTLHPQFLGSAYVWWRSTAQTQEIMVMHEVVDVVPYEENLAAGRRNRAPPPRRPGDTINAVLWSSDVRSFTALSDRVPGEQVIAILDQIFDAQARAIAKHGGEILKFIGDGLLAIFPVEAPDQAARAATEALTAAGEAIASVQALGPQSPGEPPLKMVIALHYGSAIYGNIGAADRLDFTVIGPA
jgi:class 3 adenylate cyclase